MRIACLQLRNQRFQQIDRMLQIIAPIRQHAFKVCSAHLIERGGSNNALEFRIFALIHESVEIRLL